MYKKVALLPLANYFSHLCAYSTNHQKKNEDEQHGLFPDPMDDHKQFMTVMEIYHHLVLNLSGNLKIRSVEIGKTLKMIDV